MSNQRIVSFAYFVVAIVLLVVLNQLLTQIWAQGQFPDYQIIGQFGMPWAIAAVITAVAVVLVVRSSRVNPFLLEVVGELREVTWPTRQETTSHTVVVIVTVLVLAAILGFFDVIWSRVAKFLLNPNL
jgi:preprotein translocase subunit SecE